MKRILFVCHGNICRSVMAEMIMKQMVREAGRETEFIIDSAATSTEETGNDIYPPAKDCLRRHGVTYERHEARQVTRADYDAYDMILCADSYNVRNLRYNLGSEIMAKDATLRSPKIRLLMSLVNPHGERMEVADPWYTGDFEATYRDVVAGCEAIMKM